MNVSGSISSTAGLLCRNYLSIYQIKDHTKISLYPYFTEYKDLPCLTWCYLKKLPPTSSWKCGEKCSGLGNCVWVYGLGSMKVPIYVAGSDTGSYVSSAEYYLRYILDWKLECITFISRKEWPWK